MAVHFVLTDQDVTNPLANDATNSTSVPHHAEHTLVNNEVGEIGTWFTKNGTTAANHPLLQGANSGSPGFLTVGGADTDIGLTVQPKGAGTLTLSAGSTSYIILSGTNVGLGTTSPNAQLQVSAGSASTKGLIVKGAASQTGSLQEWQDSSGTALALVNSGGNIVIENKYLQIGGTGSIRGDDANQEILFGTSSMTFQSYHFPVFTFKDSESLDTITIEPRSQLMKVPNYTFPTSADGYYSGFDGIAGTAGGNSIFRGGDSQTTPPYTGGNAGHAYIRPGKHTDNSMGHQGTVGHVIFSAYTGGTSATLFEVARIQGGTGFIGIGTTSPAAQLEVDASSASNVCLLVTGYASQSANLQEWHKSDGTLYSAVNSLGQLVLATSAGAPSGTPATGTMVYDTTNNKIWVYNGSWKGVALT